MAPKFSADNGGPGFSCAAITDNFCERFGCASLTKKMQ
jgi:hypothetical protein